MSLPATAQSWINKSHITWGDGAWNDEPDKISWTDEATGRPCLIHRNGMGALCGYVAVDPGHPLHNVDYDNVDVDVHGGLTYAAFCADTDDEAFGICHIPETGRPDTVWWFGFDCAHGGDLCPVSERAYERSSMTRFGTDVYRDVAYVVEQCEQLATQLVGLGKSGGVA